MPDVDDTGTTDLVAMTYTPPGRDFDKNPYSPDEQRVADWLRKQVPQIGTGDDPIGFVLSSYALLLAERKTARAGVGMDHPGAKE